MHLSVSPLEALALRYSATRAGPVWAWLAVVFAVLSLWRILAVGSSSTRPDRQPDPQKKLPPMPPPTVSVGPTENKLVTASPGCHVERGDWDVTKGRFTAYFNVEGEEGEESDGVSDVDSDEETVRPLSKWEGLSRDLGWYRYVDLTALDGNVVRLWDRDGGLRRRSV